MDALSKKHFYDIIKCSQEDTILESDPEFDPESGDTANPTSDVGCNTRTRRKSLAIQTTFNRKCNNFRNESTSTNLDENYHNNEIAIIKPYDAEVQPNRTIVKPVTAVTKSIKTDAPEVIHVCDVQTTISFNLIKSQKSCNCVAVDNLDLQATKHISVGKDTPSIKINKCICTENKVSDKCVDVCIASCRRSMASSRSFSLGTAEYRKFQKNACQTKLIGGCRVPVCNNSKTRF